MKCLRTCSYLHTHLPAPIESATEEMLRSSPVHLRGPGARSHVHVCTLMGEVYDREGPNSPSTSSSGRVTGVR